MIRTTVIGSQPEFETGILRTGLDEYECTRPGLDVAGIKEELAEQRKLNMEHQLATRLDILAEGEVGRVDRDAMGHAYVTYIGRFMSGLSPLYHKSLNDDPPLVVTGPLTGLNPEIICDDWERAQALSDRPVKINLPGPLTFALRFANLHHRRTSECSYEFACILNEQIQALTERGCRWIQLDDPGLFASQDYAHEFGLAHLNIAFKGTPKGTEQIVHLCRGNEYLIRGRKREHLEAPYYLQFANFLSDSEITGVSIESPHDYCNEFQLNLFGEKKILLGIIDVNDDFPSENQMVSIIQTALADIPSNQLFITPNCGIKHLSHDNAGKLLNSMISAVDRVNSAIR